MYKHQKLRCFVQVANKIPDCDALYFSRSGGEFKVVESNQQKTVTYFPDQHKQGH